MANTVITERPSWLKKRLAAAGAEFEARKILSEEGVLTVCESALCPNRNECFANKQATFLLLGDICTRDCSFCSVKRGVPRAPDNTEPARIAEAARRLDIRYAVVTSVTRDDLEDGGARQFADVIGSLRSSSRAIKVEILTPDFKGDPEALRRVIEARPDVFGHNIETVGRLYPTVRSGAGYRRSLGLLRRAKDIRASQLTKSSIMVGLGEGENDILAAMRDLREAGCDILTIGQYLRPAQANIPVSRYVTPEEFEKYKESAVRLGFRYVASGPFVRSSYMAEKIYTTINRRQIL